MTNLSPLRYPGGKNKIYDKVLKILKPYNPTTYIEPFAGGASLPIKLLHNNEVEKIIINNYDKAVYAFWYSVLNHTDELIELIKNEAITIENWHKHKAILKNKESESDLLKLGFSMLFLNRTNRSGILNAGVIGGLKQESNYKLNCRFNKDKIIEKIKLISEMRDNIELHNMDVNEFITTVVPNVDNSFTFFDPPYYYKGKSLYPEFFTEINHIALHNTIEKYMMDKNWIITYDNVDEIKCLYSNYIIEEFSMHHSAANKGEATEIMILGEKKTKAHTEFKRILR